ncbi:CsgG/HfaB family protein [Desulfobacterium sp. N47]|uniref:Uncharacterized protein n=1 Tax=uncultured Desulfobacterium sp. TaxID=201089 RepID=E1Y848_9BACT|nr:hypothetical protein N47_A07710 [uncultured Desulfobacterium sp.]
MKPAEINLASYKTIAIGNIDGTGGKEVEGLLTQELNNCGRFEVVDRAHTGNILHEQNLNMTDSFDSQSGAKLGKMMGSSALIFGNITRHNYDQKSKTNESTCYNANKQKYTCYTYYIDGIWNLNTQFKVVDTSTGKILATKAIKSDANKSVSEEGKRPSIDWDRDTVFEGLYKKTVDDFMRMIAPYRVIESVTIFEDGSLPDLENGRKFAERGDWNLAVERFKSACNTADSNPEIKPKWRARAHYNLGIALGYSGMDYKQALDELQKAQNFYPGDDECINAIGKINEFQADERKLKEQGASLN